MSSFFSASQRCKQPQFTHLHEERRNSRREKREEKKFAGVTQDRGRRWRREGEREGEQANGKGEERRKTLAGRERERERDEQARTPHRIRQCARERD